MNTYLGTRHLLLGARTVREKKDNSSNQADETSSPSSSSSIAPEGTYILHIASQTPSTKCHVPRITNAHLFRLDPRPPLRRRRSRKHQRSNRVRKETSHLSPRPLHPSRPLNFLQSHTQHSSHHRSRRSSSQSFRATSYYRKSRRRRRQRRTRKYPPNPTNPRPSNRRWNLRQHLDKNSSPIPQRSHPHPPRENPLSHRSQYNAKALTTSPRSALSSHPRFQSPPTLVLGHHQNPPPRPPSSPRRLRESLTSSTSNRRRRKENRKMCTNSLSPLIQQSPRLHSHTTSQHPSHPHPRLSPTYRPTTKTRPRSPSQHGSRNLRHGRRLHDGNVRKTIPRDSAARSQSFHSGVSSQSSSFFWLEFRAG